MRILIADDDADIRTMLQRILEKAGYEVVPTEDGQQAWEALRDGGIRLAILDWMMPGMDGPTICRKLLAKRGLQSVYAIVLTARGGSENMTIALDAGASDYVVKPFSKAELLARVRAGQRIVELQAQLAEAHKLESIGQLAAGIAHEINTPTQYVGDNTRFLKDAFEDLVRVLQKYGKLHRAAKEHSISEALLAEVEAALNEADTAYLVEEIPTAIDQSLEGVDRVAHLVRAMKEFAHPGTTEKTPTNIAHAIENTITVARNEWKYVAEMLTEFDPDLPPVPCLPHDFNQVILNLIVNAAHAIANVKDQDSKGKGTITISARRCGDWAEIRVRDTGTGIPERHQTRIFDPFFTTKEVGRGTGQGLAIAHSAVVDKHGGTIDFETCVGQGTTFIIRLPLGDSDTINDTINRPPTKRAERNEDTRPVC